MIYRNDEPYSLTEEDKAEVYKFMGWKYKPSESNYKPIVSNAKPKRAIIKFPEHLYRFNRANNRKMRPNRVHIPLEITEFIDNVGTVKWNYCVAPPRLEDKVWIYPRKVEPMTGVWSVGTDKIDFLFFLIKSPYRENLPHEHWRQTAAKTLFKIEMRELEAQIRLEKDRLQTRIRAYINGPENIVWPIEKIRKYAIAFGVDVDDEMGPFEVKAALLGRINGEINGYERFEKMVNTDGEVKIRYAIKKLQEANKILFVDTARRWVYLTKNGKEGAPICTVRKGMSNEDSLFSYLMDNQHVQEEFETLMGVDSLPEE